MKLTITILTLVLTSCYEMNQNTLPNPTLKDTAIYKFSAAGNVYIFESEGHKFLLAYTGANYGGVCMIHHPACLCNTSSK